MTRKKLFLLSILSGLLFFLAWPAHGFAPLIFIAFVPLLILEDYFFKSNEKKGDKKVFWFFFLTFFIWNASTTWWIINATLGGGIMAVLFDTFLMSFAFYFFHKTKKRIGEKFSWLILISYWLTYEFIHLNWDLSFSWLMLGNVFSKYCGMVQWYEYTGVFGGSLWVLGVNLVIAKWLTENELNFYKIGFRRFISLVAIILIPFAFSFIIGMNHEDPADKRVYTNVVIIQPNIDPYDEKFSGNYQEQLNKMLKLAETNVDSNTEYLIFPETALQENIWEGEWKNTYSIPLLQNFAKKYPKLNIITGASTYREIKPGEKRSATAHKFTKEDTWYEEYNTALQIDHNGNIQIYHKSKLVPFVEKTPFPSIFGSLEALAIKMGGMSGSLTGQDDRSIFVSADGKIKIAPAVCYESIYGNFMRQYIQNGANFICVITNDGWWGDTQGYLQHLSYASLRAIETRRCVVRCANTGVSCFVDEMGNQTQNTKWWEQTVIKARIPVLSGETFYVKFGDYLVYPFLFFSIIFCVYGFYLRFRK